MCIYTKNMSNNFFSYFSFIWSAFEEDGKVFCWGWNKYGQVIYLDSKRTFSITQISARLPMDYDLLKFPIIA